MYNHFISCQCCHTNFTHIFYRITFYLYQVEMKNKYKAQSLVNNYTRDDHEF